MKDTELKSGRVYFSEVVDKESAHFEKQYKLKFTGIRFIDITDKKNVFYLSQIKIFRVVDYKELTDEY